MIRLDDDPVRRNLLITLSYHELSSGLAGALGADNANWCTFATWASHTAGRFIRDDEVPAAFRLLLGRSEPVRVTLARVNAALVRADHDAVVDDDRVLEVVRDIVHDVAELITAGNLAVFGELGPLFSRTIDALAADPRPTALDALASTLSEGFGERGGQSLLRSALGHYATARAERDAQRKAALMLLANGQVGLHEQIRLQPFIAGSIDAPIRDALFEVLEESGEGLPHVLAREVHAVLSRLLHPVVDEAERLWQEFATRELMTLALPDGELLLGKDLPSPPGAPLYPPVLDPIDDPETVELLAQYGADGTRTATVDWTRLSERMRYILDLFRSRQCDAALLGAPFSDGQRDAILAGRRVTGPL